MPEFRYGSPDVNCKQRGIVTFSRREAYDLIDILAPDLDECSRTRFVDEFTAAAEMPSVYRVAGETIQELI
jgi:hypothetical protein